MLIPDIKKLKRAEIAFFDAFLNLLAEKDYMGISISDIVAASGYSRSAFYANFVDKDEMFKRLIDHYVLSYVHSSYDVYRFTLEKVVSSYYHPMTNVFKTAYEGRKFYHLLFNDRIPGHNITSFFLATDAYNKNMYDVMHVCQKYVDPEMTFYISGMQILNFLMYWDLNDWKFSAEYMAKNAAVLLPKIEAVSLSPDKRVVLLTNPTKREKEET